MPTRSEVARLVEENIGLARHFANRYGEDAVQEACIGLLRAAERYDPARGRFSTIAAWWIRAYVSRALRREARWRGRHALDAARDDDGAGAVEHAASPTPSPEDYALAASVAADAVRSLRGPRAKDIATDMLQRRFEDPDVPFADTARDFGVCGERVRQVAALVRERLRAA